VDSEKVELLFDVLPRWADVDDPDDRAAKERDLPQGSERALRAIRIAATHGLADYEVQPPTLL
jgi:hypothetical protein